MKPVAFASAAVALAGVASLALSAAAQPKSAADAVHMRQTNYKALGAAFKGLHDELQKPAPEKAVLQKYAVQLDSLARHVNEWFPPGSGPEAGVKTAAKPEIWKNPAEFHKDAQALGEQSAKLVQVADTGDIAAVKAQAQATSQTCGACHKVFKVRDKD
jgi:cytochrome c556